MKKTVPLKKDLTFKNNISEIVSIALDHELNLEDRTIKGNLVISGSYSTNDENTLDFKYNIPVNIEMSDRYKLDNITIDIDDFYYEINDNKLIVSIEIGLDNLEEVLPPFKYEEEKIEKVFKEEDMPRVDTNDVKNIFDNFDDSSETYSTYKVCIVKENDNIESIILKYNITKELLEQYNDISDIKIGDKLIIPSLYETN
ncbi:MAG TPA: LysM peptidoglycan-binding domain-containing protein [Candidatus Faecisoma merdavium]|nr:LysM peptidoglycan-binding domain-containing protein [Candidatus Faecisoma merdavium]